jgi:hypothetical protein
MEKNREVLMPFDVIRNPLYGNWIIKILDKVRWASIYVGPALSFFIIQILWVMESQILLAPYFWVFITILIIAPISIVQSMWTWTWASYVFDKAGEINKMWYLMECQGNNVAINRFSIFGTPRHHICDIEEIEVSKGATYFYIKHKDFTVRVPITTLAYPTGISLTGFPWPTNFAEEDLAQKKWSGFFLSENPKVREAFRKLPPW